MLLCCRKLSRVRFAQVIHATMPMVLQLTAIAATAPTRQVVPTHLVLAYCQLIGSHHTTVLSCSSIVAPHASRSATGTISFLGEADPPVPTFESSAKQCPECRSRSCSYGAFYDDVKCSYCGSAGDCGCQYETPNPESTIWCHLRAAPPAYIDNRLSQSVRSTLLIFFALA
jgi:hypothetical protein